MASDVRRPDAAMLYVARALRIMLLCCALAPLASASQTIEGQIRNTANGEAVPGVKVRIFPADGTPANGFATTTDSEGRFRIEGVAEGAYRAMYAAPGFKSIPDPGAMPNPFAVPHGDQPVRLEVTMTPLAHISGRVVDAAGKPVPNAGIWLVAEEKWCMPPDCHPDHRQSKSVAEGEFVFTDLQPGSWLVAATAPPSWNPPKSPSDEPLGWTQTFYPGVADPSLAEAVTLRPGGERNVDIKLATSPVHRVHGKVLDPHGAPVARAAIRLDRGLGPTLMQQTKSDGTFDFDAVVEGRWLASAALDQGGVKLKAAETIELREHDLENIALRLNAPFLLHGTIVVEVADGAPFAQRPDIDMGIVPVTDVLADGPADFLVIRSDGDKLETRDVYPGLYRVQFLTDSPVPYFVDSIHLGEQEALGSFPIVSGELPLTVTLKLGGGSVRGTVEGCASRHVFLVPQEPARRRDGFIRITTCGANGRFEFAAVRPGEYYGFAATKEPRSFMDLSDDHLLQQASKLTVRTNETTSADIRLIER